MGAEVTNMQRKMLRELLLEKLQKTSPVDGEAAASAAGPATGERPAPAPPNPAGAGHPNVDLTPDDLDWASFGLRQHAKCRVGDNARRYLEIADKLDPNLKPDVFDYPLVVWEGRPFTTPPNFDRRNLGAAAYGLREWAEHRDCEAPMYWRAIADSLEAVR
jgi:hypothetical protein